VERISTAKRWVLIKLISSTSNAEEIHMAGILWFLIVLMVIFWALGFAFHVGGGLIHLLLVIALIALVFNIVTGRGARV
jgi:hypothetical protein